MAWQSHRRPAKRPGSVQKAHAPHCASVQHRQSRLEHGYNQREHSSQHGQFRPRNARTQYGYGKLRIPQRDNAATPPREKHYAKPQRTAAACRRQDCPTCCSKSSNIVRRTVVWIHTGIDTIDPANHIPQHVIQRY